jgi:transposase-like protein
MRLKRREKNESLTELAVLASGIQKKKKKREKIGRSLDIRNKATRKKSRQRYMCRKGGNIEMIRDLPQPMQMLMETPKCP